MPTDVKRRDFFLVGAGALSGLAPLASAQTAPSATQTPRRTLLVIGAHFDDCEIGAGGVIVKAVKNGHRVVVLNVVGDYSTWLVTRGRELRIRQWNDDKAREMGVEKRYLDYGYQQVFDNLDTLRKIAAVVVDVKPDVSLFNDCQERERAPSDHSKTGAVAEQAVRNAATILGGIEVAYGKEMYAYEVDPQRDFQADAFVDIGDVLPSVLETINAFRKLNAEVARAEAVGRIESTVTLTPGGPALPLTSWGEIKLSTARFRGRQCGVRFAEAFRTIDKRTIGNRMLQQMVQ